MKRLLIVLSIVICYACYLVLVQIIFGDNDLISIKGKLLNKFNFAKTETVGKNQVDYIYLNFRLRGDDRFYTLKLATTDKAKDSRVFGGVDLGLKHAGELEVFIRKGDLASLSPKVYQIKADGEHIFSMKTPPGNNTFLYTLLLLLLALFCFIYWLIKRPMNLKLGS